MPKEEETHLRFSRTKLLRDETALKIRYYDSETDIHLLLILIGPLGERNTSSSTAIISAFSH